VIYFELLQVLRLKDIDAGFFGRFEERVSSGGRSPVEKDYFEPGVPEALRKHSTLHETDAGVTLIHLNLCPNKPLSFNQAPEIHLFTQSWSR
jgi:hypothetical protein